MNYVTQKFIIEIMNNHETLKVSLFRGLNETQYQKRYKTYINYVYKSFPNARIYEKRDFVSCGKYGVSGAIDSIDIFDNEKGHIFLLIGYVNKNTSKYFKWEITENEQN